MTLDELITKIETDLYQEQIENEYILHEINALLCRLKAKDDNIYFIHDVEVIQKKLDTIEEYFTVKGLI